MPAGERQSVVDFRVLVVDDEVDFVETLVARLNKRKIPTKGAASGEAALALLAEEPFDLVILDVKMGRGMDGIETLREIKSGHPATEVLLLTGHASRETSNAGTRLGAFDYLVKPVDLEQLRDKLTQAAERREADPERRQALIRSLLRHW